MSYQPKIALVHDDFIQSGGAESLFSTIASLYPKAPIYTSIVDWKKLPNTIKKENIRASFIQKIPLAKKFYKAILPLYPFAFESFDFAEFDLVISSTTRFAKSIITKPSTVHISYVNSTPRFLWSQKAADQYLPKTAQTLLRPLLSHLRRWDKIASSRVDFYIANSKNVQHQIKDIYERESEVIYPFADLDFFDLPKIHNWQLKSQNYFLIVSRLVRWKKIELAIRACQKLQLKLKIVGTGPDEPRLKKIARDQHPTENGSSIEFLGRVDLNNLRELYQNSKALIVTQEEDFGISAVEAQACGIPVLAYAKGGQVEVVTEKTGILYQNQSEKSLEDAISASLNVKWSKSECRKNSQRFSRGIFEEEFKKNIAANINNYKP